MSILSKAKIGFNRVNVSLGKKIFGNSRGITYSISGLNNLDKSIDDDLEKNNPELFSLKKNGYTKFKNSYDKSLIFNLQKKFESLINDNAYSFPLSGYENTIYSRAILDPEKNFPELASLITNDVKSIAQGYFKSHFKIKHIQCSKNYHVPENITKEHEMFANFWHCDARRSDELKYFVYMSDVTEEDGPFHIQSIKRTKELIKLGFGNRDHYDLPLNTLEDPSHVIKITGHTGTSFFGNVTVCLHRAGDPAEGHTRNIVQFFFGPSDHQMTDNWLNEVEPYNYMTKDLPYFIPNRS